MFSNKHFAYLYDQLNVDMVDGDCGIKCGKFCCEGISADGHNFKYLLPGEVYLLIEKGFHEYAQLEDYGFVIRYDSLNNPGRCACEQIRAFRPFCCRMFPFRPQIDVENRAVVDLIKASNRHLSPCWIQEPNPLFKERAIAAWNFVFSDIDNLAFYSSYYFVMVKAEQDPTISYKQALEQDPAFKAQLESLGQMSQQDLWENTNRFFQLILTQQFE